MNCEPSEPTSSQRDEQQNQDEINEFKREIEERFKLSIANKIYTFPKHIARLEDIVSSSESEEEDNTQPNPHPRKDRVTVVNFKKKSHKQQSGSKGQLNDSSHLADSAPRLPSSRKNKEKRTKELLNKRKESPSREKKEHMKVDISLKSTNKARKRYDGKSEQENSGSLIECIKTKIKRN